MGSLSWIIAAIQNLSPALALIVLLRARLYLALEHRSPLLASGAAGLALGLAGMAGMLLPVHPAAGISLDGRSALIVLSVVTCGWPAGIITTLMLSLFHLLPGESGAIPAILGAAGSLGLGGWVYWQKAALRRQRIPVDLLSGAAAALSSATWMGFTADGGTAQSRFLILAAALTCGLFTWLLTGVLAGEMERAGLDERHERLDQAMRTIRRCEQSVVKAENEPDLLHQVCQIIVSNSRYAYVWVGFSEPDTGCSVRLAASSGRGSYDFGLSLISWGEGPMEEGPIGRAVRSRQPALCNDAAADPADGPWREDAMRHGFGSSLVLPLLHQGSVLGVLAIYAVSKHAFDSEEIRLLQDLAIDLAYGIAGLRLQAEKQSIERVLEQTERQLALIFQAAPEAFLIISREDNRILAVNDGFVHLTGYRSEEVLGLTTLEVNMWVDPAERERLYAELLEKGKVVNFEIHPRLKSGRIIPFLIQLVPIRYHDRDCVLAMGLDISELKKQAESLRLSETTFRLLINSTVDGVLLIDLQGRVLEANEVMSVRLKVAHDRLVGTNVYEILPPEVARLRREKAQEVIGLQHSVRFEDHNQDRWLEQIVSPVFNDQKEVVSLAVVARDITERKQADETQRRSEEAYRLLAATLEARVSQRTRELEVLYKVSSAASAAISTEEVMNETLRLAVEGMDLTEGSIYLLGAGEDPASLKLAAVYGARPDGRKELFREDCLILQVAKQDRAIFSPDMSQEAPCSQCIIFTEPQAGRTACSFLGVPMHAQARLVGVLNVFGEVGQSFTVEEIALIETLADQIAVSNENVRLRQQMEAAAIKEERARLGRELHDSVTQEIYSLMLFSETARRVFHDGKTEQTDALLERIFDISHQALKEMRLMVYDLHPLALEQAGLGEALYSRLEAVEHRSGMEIEFEARGELEKLPADLQQELYWMAIEALNNATKHARAGRISVEVFLEENAVSLNIKDDGQGFDRDAAAETGGLGLHSLQERAARLDGQLLIETSPGQGTSVHIRVPLDNHKEKAGEGHDQ